MPLNLPQMPYNTMAQAIQNMQQISTNQLKNQQTAIQNQYLPGQYAANNQGLNLANQATGIKNTYLPGKLDSANRTAAWLAANPEVAYDPALGVYNSLHNGTIGPNGLPTTGTGGGSGLFSQQTGPPSTPPIASASNQNQVTPQMGNGNGSGLFSGVPSPATPQGMPSSSGVGPSQPFNKVAMVNQPAQTGQNALQGTQALNNYQMNLGFSQKGADLAAATKNGIPADQANLMTAKAVAMGLDPNQFWIDQGMHLNTPARLEAQAQAAGFPSYDKVVPKYAQSGANVTALQSQAEGTAGAKVASQFMSDYAANYAGIFGQNTNLKMSNINNYLDSTSGGDPIKRDQAESTLAKGVVGRMLTVDQATLNNLMLSGKVTEGGIDQQLAASEGKVLPDGLSASSPGLYKKIQEYRQYVSQKIFEGMSNQALSSNPTQVSSVEDPDARHTRIQNAAKTYPKAYLLQMANAGGQ